MTRFILVCGDDVCELEENCLNCPADCGVCPMSITIKVAIGLPVTLFCSGFILTLVVSLSNTQKTEHMTARICLRDVHRFSCFTQWFQYQKQKMFWDESWIINYNNLVFGKIIHAQALLVHKQ